MNICIHTLLIYDISVTSYLSGINAGVGEFNALAVYCNGIVPVFAVYRAFIIRNGQIAELSISAHLEVDNVCGVVCPRIHSEVAVNTDHVSGRQLVADIAVLIVIRHSRQCVNDHSAGFVNITVVIKVIENGLAALIAYFQLCTAVIADIVSKIVDSVGPQHKTEDIRLSESELIVGIKPSVGLSVYPVCLAAVDIEVGVAFKLQT